jgi:ElaB/YqjD/DUF883 family membrane-anchored ribosome-binding protein
VGEVVEKAREAVNDGLDSAKERLADQANQLDRRYRKTLDRARRRAKRLSGNVQDQIGDARETLADGWTQARKKASRLDRDTRAYVRHNPVKSLLIATGVGFLAGVVAGYRRRR